jgi:hypothetical protein
MQNPVAYTLIWVVVVVMVVFVPLAVRLYQHAASR